jgi:hypothetical protein
MYTVGKPYSVKLRQPAKRGSVCNLISTPDHQPQSGLAFGVNLLFRGGVRIKEVDFFNSR